jgi:hypothetical protein
MPRMLLPAILAVLALTACGGPQPSGHATQPPASSAPVRVSLRDAGEVVRLSLGQRLVVAPGAGAGASRWIVARFPRAALERTGDRRVAGRHIFEAVAEGRGQVLLLNLAAWPEGPCDPTAINARRCLMPLAASGETGSEPANMRVLSLQIVVG